MPTIPSINIVVQQSSKALKVQNTQQVADPALSAQTTQEARETELRSTVQDTEDSEKTKLDGERSGGGHGETGREPAGKKKEDEKKPSGRLLDIVV